MNGRVLYLGWRVVVLATIVAVAAAGCGGVHRQLTEEPRSAAVNATVTAAAAAAMSHDPAAWQAAMPAEGTQAEAASRQLFAGLTRYEWKNITAQAVAVDRSPGRYCVTFSGEYPGSGVTHTVCERVLDFAKRNGVLTLLADHTPAAHRADYCLAFRHPVVMVRKHLVLIGDRSQMPLMRLIAATDGQSRRVVARLRLDPTSFWVKQRTLVYVCATARQARRLTAGEASLGDGAFAGRGCICVIARSPERWQSQAPAIMRHELTHVYSSSFGEGNHYVGLLNEGLAVLVEGDYSYAHLRFELAKGRLMLPLEKALMQENVWQGRTHRQVVVAYEEGGSLVQYIEKRWGLKRLWQFAHAVADSDMTATGIERATRLSLGATWGQIQDGWKWYVRTLP